MLHTLTDQGRRLSAESYLHREDKKELPVISTLSEFTAEPFVVKQILTNRFRSAAEAEGRGFGDLQVGELNYLYKESGRSDLIRIWAKDRLHVPLPLAFIKEVDLEAQITFRSFTGISSDESPFPFQKMEEKEDSETVYVFPRAGERYHIENCSVIKVSPRQETLTDKLRGKYKACGNCKPSDLSNGSLVYCFPAAGSAFHRGSCSSVERYVIPLEKEDALAQGYTACKKCGG